MWWSSDWIGNVGHLDFELHWALVFGQLDFWLSFLSGFWTFGIRLSDLDFEDTIQ